MKQSASPMRMLAAAMIVAGATMTAHAQQVVLKVHHFLPSTSNAQVNIIQPWCDKVNKDSKDRIKCQIYPAMQLGGTPPQLFDQARDGVADVVWTIPTYAAGRFVKSEVFELPFMVPSAKVGSQALWTYVQKNSLDEFKGTKLLFTHMHDGTLLFFKDKTPAKLEDLKGLRIRAATRINSQMMAALGATPVQQPLPAVPESLSKGVIDGASVPWEGVPSIKLQEIAKYTLETPVGKPRMANAIFVFAMNQAKYDALAPDLKKVIDDNSGMVPSTLAGEKGFDSVVEAHRKLMRDQGGTLTHMPAAEYDRWVKATESVADAWVKSTSEKGADGKKLLDEARALIKQFDK